MPYRYQKHFHYITIMLALSLTACKKEYTCTCASNWVNPSTNIAGRDTIITTFKETKGNAESRCKARENQLDLWATSAVSCKLQ